MEKYIIWYTLSNFEHVDDACEVIDKIKDLDNIDAISAITVEHFVGGRYIGETDYSVRDFLEYIE